jgi:hypothetical protein
MMSKMYLATTKWMKARKGNKHLRCEIGVVCVSFQLFLRQTLAQIHATRFKGGVGRLAQLEEHLVYTERVGGSSPSAPTISHSVGKLIAPRAKSGVGNRIIAAFWGTLIQGYRPARSPTDHWRDQQQTNGLVHQPRWILSPLRLGGNCS